MFRRMAVLLWTCAALGAAGCSMKPVWPESETNAGRAADVAEGVIVVRTEGSPDDEVDVATGTLTMNDAVRRALHTSPTLQMSLARVRLAYAEAQGARLLPNPVLSVVLRWPEGGGSGPTIEAGLAAELLSLVAKPGQVKAADHRLRATGAEAVTTALDVATDVRARYVEIASLDAMAAVLEERQRLVEQMQTLARQRLDAGEGTRLDLTTIQAQQVSLQVEVTEQTLARRQAALALARLMGEPGSSLQWTVVPNDALPAIVDEAAWITAALSHRPEIESATWELAALGVERSQARWLIFEGMEAGVDAERDGGEWTVGPAVAMPIPLMDWGQAKASVADARRLEAMHGLTAVRRQVIEEVRQAHAAYRSHAQAMRMASEQLLPLLERRRSDSEAAYRAGESDLLPVVLAEEQLQAGRAQLIELQRKTQEAMVQLQRTAGGAVAVDSLVEEKP